MNEINEIAETGASKTNKPLNKKPKLSVNSVVCAIVVEILATSSLCAGALITSLFAPYIGYWEYGAIVLLPIVLFSGAVALLTMAVRKIFLKSADEAFKGGAQFFVGALIIVASICASIAFSLFFASFYAPVELLYVVFIIFLDCLLFGALALPYNVAMVVGAILIYFVGAFVLTKLCVKRAKLVLTIGASCFALWVLIIVFAGGAPSFKNWLDFFGILM